jgi:hypothetical protein
MAAPVQPPLNWNAIGLGVSALGVIASVATHKSWRAIFGIAAWTVLCATVVYSTDGLGASLPWRVVVAILVTTIVGAVAWPATYRKPKVNGSLNAADEVSDLKQKIIGLRDDVYQANDARDEMRAERDICKKELQEMTAQRDHVEGQWKTLLRNMDATMVSRSIADQLAEEGNALQRRLDGITPLVNFYRDVFALTKRLQSFRDNMEEVQVGDRDQELRDIARIAEENATAYASDFRPDLVRLATYAKQRFGLVYPGLTDESLVRDVRGQQSLDESLQSLRDMTGKIRDMLLNEALEINPK